MIYRICLTLWVITAILPDARAQFAFDDAVMGYAYGDHFSSMQFDYLYSREQGDIVSLNPSTGVYTIQFHGASPQGSFIPMASWPSAITGNCTIADYGFGLTPTFSTFRWGTIHCFDDAGNPANGWHQLMLVDEGSADGDNSYLAFADSQESAPSGNFLDLSKGSTHNPSGGITTLTRLGTGQYNVTFNGLGAVMPAGSAVHVVPVSAGTARSCRVDDWTLHFAGSDNARVRIYCYGLPGSGLTDSRFVVLLTSTESSASAAASVAVSNQTPPEDWTTLSGINVHNPHGQVQFRWRDAHDMYQVRFEWPGDTAPGVAFASPASSLLHGCPNGSAHRLPGDADGYLYVNVVCRRHNGERSSGGFNLLMTQVIPGPPPDLIFGDRFQQ